MGAGIDGAIPYSQADGRIPWLGSEIFAGSATGTIRCTRPCSQVG